MLAEHSPENELFRALPGGVATDDVPTMPDVVLFGATLETVVVRLTRGRLDAHGKEATGQPAAAGSHVAAHNTTAPSPPHAAHDVVASPQARNVTRADTLAAAAVPDCVATAWAVA